MTVLRFFFKVTLDQGWTVLNQAEIDIVRNRDESADTHADFRIVTQGVEIGAGRIRRGDNSGRDYVSLSLAVPGFVLRKLNVGFNDRWPPTDRGRIVVAAGSRRRATVGLREAAIVPVISTL